LNFAEHNFSTQLSKINGKNFFTYYNTVTTIAHSRTCNTVHLMSYTCCSYCLWLYDSIS